MPRDQRLAPGEYHQFWQTSGPEKYPNQHKQKKIMLQLLEDRVNNPKSPEEGEAAKNILLNGPKEGGNYQKTKKSKPGEPGAEDFIDREDRSPII